MSQFIYGFLAAIVIPVIVLFSAGYLGFIPQIKPLVVQSGSMEPAIKTGSVVFSQKSPDYKKGDVITFSPDNSKTLVTHRIFSFDGTYFQTKGDANEEADFWKIKPDQIKGKVFLYIPGLGYWVDFVKQPKGFIFLVIIPATIIIYEELKTIKAELAKLLLRFRPIASAGGALKMMAIFPLFGLGLLLVTFTGSFFLDQEEALNNVFAAASSFGSPSPTPSPSPSPSSSPTPTPSPTPSPGNLVINEVMFNPPNTNACGSENNAEWVEIYNPTVNPVNLDTWLVGDSNSTDDLPNVSLPAGGFAIVVADCSQSNFNSIWALPGGTIFINLAGALGNGLNNGGEHMSLLNGAALIDDMSYGSNTVAFNPSIAAPVANHSLERNPAGVDTNTAADFVDRTTPTPGT